MPYSPQSQLPVPVRPSRLLLCAALSLGALSLGSVRAQTLIDTTVSTGISTTLDKTVTPTSGGLKQIQDARRAADLLSGHAADTQATPTTPGAAAQPNQAPATSAATVPARPAPPSGTYTAALQEARTLLQDGDLQGARRAFETVIAGDYAQPAAHFGLGATLAATGDLRGAAFEFSETLRYDPANVQATFNLGMLARLQGDATRAGTQFARAAELARAAGSSDLSASLSALADVQSRTNDTNLSATLQELHALHPGDHALTLRFAASLAASGRGLLALPLLYAERKADPANVPAARLTALIYHQEGLDARALSELSAAGEHATPAGRAELLRARADLLARDQPKLALLTLQQAAKLSPRDAGVQDLLGTLYARTGQDSAALAAWIRAVTLAPRSVSALTHLAGAELSAHAPLAALTRANEALKLNPGVPLRARLLLIVGVAHAQRGEHRLALDALNASVRGGGGPDALRWQASEASALHQDAQAAAALRSSELARPDPRTRQALATTLLALGQPAEAGTLILPLLHARPDSAQLWYLLGLARRAQGNEAAALGALSHASGLGSSEAKIALKH